MKNVVLIVFAIACLTAHSQEISLQKRVMASDSVVLADYDSLIGFYIEKDVDSAMYFINFGIGKPGGSLLYPFYKHPNFYPYNSTNYLQARNYADSILNLAVGSKDTALCQQLRHAYLFDQMFRLKTNVLLATPNFFADSANVALFQSVMQQQLQYDAKNTALLDSLLNVYGKKLIVDCPCDINAVRAVNLIIMHADANPTFQYKVLSKYKKSIIKRYGAEGYAFMYDRCMTNLGKKPVYYIYNRDNLIPDNVRKVNKRRKKLGLEQMAN
jgi:hypothetical protein